MLAKKERIMFFTVLLLAATLLCGCSRDSIKSSIEDKFNSNVEVVTMKTNFMGNGYKGTAIFHAANEDVLFDYSYLTKPDTVTSNIALSTYAAYIKESLQFHCNDTAVQICSKAPLLENEDVTGTQGLLACPEFKIYLYTAIDDPAITYAAFKRAVEDSSVFSGDIWVYLIDEDELSDYTEDCNVTLRSDSIGDTHAYEIAVNEGQVITSLDKVEKSCKKFKIMDTIYTLIGG